MEQSFIYDDAAAGTGLTVEYAPRGDGSASVRALSGPEAVAAEASFAKTAIDEAHILYMEATELLRTRAAAGQERAAIRGDVEKLFAAFRGEKVSFGDAGPSGLAAGAARKPSGEFAANPGKQIDIEVDGVVYERLPVRTRLITLRDADIFPIVEEYAGPYLKPGDLLFISEKALTITQGRVVDMGTIKPSPLARLLARNVSTQYGSSGFRGFGHGTALAMQLFIEEAGYLRVLFAAAVSAVTRPFGLRGAFYYLCGKRAKSIDCPMSFLILEYAHAAKLAPNDPDGAARRIRRALGCETVILDANYRGAFSLGRSARGISEKFIGKLFRDNPLGQSDEMTPFCIVRRKGI
ncbi:MAG TPA: hypothetical protein VMT81_01095 [Candidatus Paceibacterota bacterium]|nr:hypothetical protein [Candidatus Paceibacterota bacterium]